MLQSCFLVGIGGFLGAACRYLLGLLPWPGGFPWGTLWVNVAGAFAIGVLSALASQGLSASWLLLGQTGFCGGFTTFSAFSLDTARLLDEGRLAVALGYACASLLLCLAGVYLGRSLGKGFL